MIYQLKKLNLLIISLKKNIKLLPFSLNSRIYFLRSPLQSAILMLPSNRKRYQRHFSSNCSICICEILDIHGFPMPWQVVVQGWRMKETVGSDEVVSRRGRR